MWAYWLMVLSAGVPSTEPELGSRHGSQKTLLNFPSRRSNNTRQEPRATLVSFHGFESGRSRELWQEVLPGASCSLPGSLWVLAPCSYHPTCLSPE